MNTYYHNTGVKFGVNPYLDEKALAVDAVGGGLVMVLPFECEVVPKGFKPFMFADNPNLTEKEMPSTLGGVKFIVREVKESEFVKSKFAYFSQTIV